MRKSIKHLERYVFITNEINRIAKIEVENIAKQLRQYIGKKIFLVQCNHPKTFVIEFLRPEIAKNEPLGIKGGNMDNYHFGRGDLKNETVIGFSFRVGATIHEKPTDKHCIGDYHIGVLLCLAFVMEIS